MAKKESKNKNENDPETPEEIKEAVEVQLERKFCDCTSTRTKKALKASYLSCLGLMALFFILAGVGMHADAEYEENAPETMFLLAVLLYITITILSLYMNKPKDSVQWTSLGLFCGACLFWFIAGIAIYIKELPTFKAFCAMGMLGCICNIAAISLLFAHALRQEDVTLGLFSFLGYLVFVLANLLFLGSFGTFITFAGNAQFGTYENAVGLILSGGIMFLIYFIFEILATFLPGIVMKIEIRNLNAES